MGGWFVGDQVLPYYDIVLCDSLQVSHNTIKKKKKKKKKMASLVTRFRGAGPTQPLAGNQVTLVLADLG